jgi:hypothetical protein
MPPSVTTRTAGAGTAGPPLGIGMLAEAAGMMAADASRAQVTAVTTAAS